MDSCFDWTKCEGERLKVFVYEDAKRKEGVEGGRSEVLSSRAVGE